MRSKGGGPLLSLFTFSAKEVFIWFPRKIKKKPGIGPIVQLYGHNIKKENEVAVA